MTPRHFVSFGFFDFINSFVFETTKVVKFILSNYLFYMGRPRKGEELRVQISGRIDSKLAQEIRTIADSLYGNLTGIIEELIALGFEEYKKRNPEIMNLVKKRQNEKFYVETFRQAANNESSEPKKKIVKR